jgi:hypothetical protein
VGARTHAIFVTSGYGDYIHAYVVSPPPSTKFPNNPGAGDGTQTHTSLRRLDKTPKKALPPSGASTYFATPAREYTDRKPRRDIKMILYSFLTRSKMRMRGFCTIPRARPKCLSRRALERGDDVADVGLLAHAGRPWPAASRFWLAGSFSSAESPAGSPPSGWAECRVSGGRSSRRSLELRPVSCSCCGAGG